MTAAPICADSDQIPTKMLPRTINSESQTPLQQKIVKYKYGANLTFDVLKVYSDYCACDSQRAALATIHGLSSFVNFSEWVGDIKI